MDVLFIYLIKIHAYLPRVMFCLDRKCPEDVYKKITVTN